MSLSIKKKLKVFTKNKVKIALYGTTTILSIIMISNPEIFEHKSLNVILFVFNLYSFKGTIKENYKILEEENKKEENNLIS